MGSLIKKRRKRMRKKKHKKMLKATRWQRRAAGKYVQAPAGTVRTAIKAARAPSISR